MPRVPIRAVPAAVLLAILSLLATAPPAAAAGSSSDLALALEEPIGSARVLAGDVRHVAFTLTNISEARVGPIAIDLDLIGGTIDEPSSEGIRWRRRHGRWEGGIRRLEAGTSVTVELIVNFLPGDTGSQSSLAGGGIVVAARVRGDERTAGPVLADDWVMANCSALFHAELQTISKTRGDALREASELAREGWRALRGRWVFEPGRVRDNEAYSKVVSAARRLVRARGVDATLRQMLDGRNMSRLMRELGNYLGQRQTPAICTGAPQFMNFLEAGFSDLRERQQATAELFETAGQQADWLLLAAEAALAETVRAQQEGGDSAGALGAVNARLSVVLRQARALWLAILDDDGTPGRLLDNVEALSGLADKVDALSIGRGSPLAERRAAVEAALGAVEAFAYIQNAHAHHQAVAGSFDMVTGAVRGAHTHRCTCGR